MSNGREPHEPDPNKNYRVIHIEGFEPLAFDIAIEAVGALKETELRNGHWRDMAAKVIIFDDSLILFSPGELHNLVYQDLIRDSVTNGGLRDAGLVEVNQLLLDTGEYETHSRRFSGNSETLINAGLLDTGSAYEFRMETLPKKLGDNFYWN